MIWTEGAQAVCFHSPCSPPQRGYLLGISPVHQHSAGDHQVVAKDPHFFLRGLIGGREGFEEFGEGQGGLEMGQLDLGSFRSVLSHGTRGDGDPESSGNSLSLCQNGKVGFAFGGFLSLL